jgi:hypothetical protein
VGLTITSKSEVLIMAPTTVSLLDLESLAEVTESRKIPFNERRNRPTKRSSFGLAAANLLVSSRFRPWDTDRSILTTTDRKQISSYEGLAFGLAHSISSSARIS